MSFLKSKRFAEPIANTAPAVGTYDPKPPGLEGSTAMDHAERFRRNRADSSCSSSSSIDSAQCSRSASKIPRSRSFKIPMDRMKFVDQEMELRRVINERNRLMKELDVKSNEIIKLEGKVSNGIKERSRIQATMTSLEKDFKELRKIEDILRARLNVLENGGKRKDIHMQLANAESQVVSCNHVIADLRLEVTAVRGEVESLSVKLSERDAEIKELKEAAAEELQSAKEYNAELEERNLSLETTQEVAVEQLDEMDSRVLILEGENSKLLETVQNLQLELDEVKQHSRQEIETVKAELNSAISTLAKSNEECAAKDAQLSTAEEELRTVQTNTEISSDELSKSKTIIAALEADLASRNLTVEELNGQLESGRVEISHLSEDVLLAKTEHEAMALLKLGLEHEISNFELEVDQLERANKLISEQLASVTKQLESTRELERIREVAEEELKQVKGDLEESKLVITDIGENLQKERNNSAKLAVQLEKLKVSAEEQRIEFLRLQDGKAAVEEKSVELKTEMEEIKKLRRYDAEEVENVKTKLVEVVTEAEERLSALNVSQDEKKKLYGRLEEIERELTLSKNIILDDRAALETLRNERMTLEEDRDETRKSLEESRQICTVHVEEIEKLRAELEAVGLISEERLGTVAKLSEELQTSNEGNRITEEEVKRLNEEKLLSESNLKDKCEEIDKLRQDVTVLMAEDESVVKKMEKLFAEKEELENCLESANLQLKSSLEQLDIALEQYAAEKENGERERMGNTETVKGYEAKIKNLTEELKMVKQEILKQRTLLEHLEGAYYDLEVMNANLKREMDNGQKDILSELAQVKNTLAEAEGKLTRVLAVNTALTIEVESNKTISEDMKMTSDELERVLATCNTQQTVIGDMHLDIEARKEKLQTLAQENQRHRANIEWFREREKELLQEVDETEKKCKDKLEDLQRLLVENQKKQVQLELQLKRQRGQREKEGRQNEEMLQTLTDQYEARLQTLAKEAKGCYEHEEEIARLKTTCQELQAKIEPFQEQLDMFEIEKKALLNQRCDATNELSKLGMQYAKLLGHQNQKQKIHHIMNLKEENLTLKQENSRLADQLLKAKKSLQKYEKPAASKQPASTVKTKENSNPLMEKNQS